MSSYVSQDVRLDEVESNINPSQEALLNIIQELEDNGTTLSEEAKSSFKIFEKSLEHRRLKKIFQTKLVQYCAGEETLQSVRQSNHDWKIKEDMKRRRRNEPLFKLNENTDKSNEGRISLFSYQKNRYVTVRFDSQLKEELFSSSIVKYKFKKEEMILLIPSFFNVLATSRDLGVPRSKLGTVFDLYCKLAIPNLQGQMNPEASCLAGNLEKLLESVSIRGERQKLETQLDMITRSPGTKLDDYVHLLFTLFNSYCTLEFIVDEKETQEDIDDLISDPSQVSRFKRVNDRIQELLRKGLRSLCSGEAQRNITHLIRKKKTRMSNEVMKEVIFKCDSRYPLQAVTKLPPSLIFLSSQDNLDYNPPLEVLEGSYGYFGRAQNPYSSSPKPPDQYQRYNQRNYERTPPGAQNGYTPPPGVQRRGYTPPGVQRRGDTPPP